MTRVPHPLGTVPSAVGAAVGWLSFRSLSSARRPEDSGTAGAAEGGPTDSALGAGRSSSAAPQQPGDSTYGSSKTGNRYLSNSHPSHKQHGSYFKVSMRWHLVRTSKLWNKLVTNWIRTSPPSPRYRRKRNPSRR
ncbi:Hypp5218 [Branchiostoma lanceolatum]|uniref:Hypp5218 protein n=1 Tax=Branchiostoma lanceolatum TaxID=7740 RepID=A0A8K0EYQ0_BRALA|nr:Hypp5218 [Branchiostoma lanceolatum]